MWLYLALALVGLLLCFIGIMGVLGSRLPQTHVASASVDLNAPIQEVWDTINDLERFPSWLPSFTKMERLPDQDGKQTWRQHMGRNSFVTINEVVTPPTRVKRTITDDRGPFSGSWDHQLTPLSDNTCRLTLTETGTVKSAIPRAFMHYFFGEDFYLKRFLAALKQHLA